MNDFYNNNQANPNGNSSPQGPANSGPVNPNINQPQQPYPANTGAYNQGYAYTNNPYQQPPQQNPQYPPSPASVYNNMQMGNTPQYHYGYPAGVMDTHYIEEQKRKFQLRRKQEKMMKKAGNRGGLALLFLLILSYAFSMLLVSPRMSELYYSSLSFSSAFAIFYSIVTVGGAFFLAYRAFAPTKEKAEVSYKKPTDAKKTLLLILIGFGGSLVANFVTSILRGVAEAFGVYSSYSAIEDPSNTMDIILMFFATAIVPPLIEEFGARGLMMHSLKKYGKGFAILGSAFVFGILHGNAVQIPFAFICALFIGYAVIATDSLWTGIIIHALVNSMSCVSSVLMYYFDEHTANLYFYITSGVGFIAGIIALVIYVSKYKDDGILSDKGEMTELSLKTRFAKFVCSPLMIIGIILFIIQAITTLTTTPTTY